MYIFNSDSVSERLELIPNPIKEKTRAESIMNEVYTHLKDDLNLWVYKDHYFTTSSYLKETEACEGVPERLIRHDVILCSHHKLEGVPIVELFSVLNLSDSTSIPELKVRYAVSVIGCPSNLEHITDVKETIERVEKKLDILINSDYFEKLFHHIVTIK